MRKNFLFAGSILAFIFGLRFIYYGSTIRWDLVNCLVYILVFGLPLLGLSISIILLQFRKKKEKLQYRLFTMACVIPFVEIIYFLIMFFVTKKPLFLNPVLENGIPTVYVLSNGLFGLLLIACLVVSHTKMQDESYYTSKKLTWLYFTTASFVLTIYFGIYYMLTVGFNIGESYLNASNRFGQRDTNIVFDNITLGVSGFLMIVINMFIGNKLLSGSESKLISVFFILFSAISFIFGEELIHSFLNPNKLINVFAGSIYAFVAIMSLISNTNKKEIAKELDLPDDLGKEHKRPKTDDLSDNYGILPNKDKNPYHKSITYPLKYGQKK